MFIYNEKKKEESLVLLDYVILKLSEEIRVRMPSDDLDTIPKTDLGFISDKIIEAGYKGVALETPGLVEGYTEIFNQYLLAMGRTYKVAVLNAKVSEETENCLALPGHGLMLEIIFDPKVEADGLNSKRGELFNTLFSYEELHKILTSCREGVSPVLTESQDLEMRNLEAKYRIARRNEAGQLIQMVADEGGLRTTTEIKLAELVKPYATKYPPCLHAKQD